MNTISINGVTIATNGRSIVVQNGHIMVDGKDVTPQDSKEINIVIHGDITSLEADMCQTISVTGEAGNIRTMNGNVTVGGNIHGSVQTMAGAVDCDGYIGGAVSTMSGNIKSHK